jgi:hypothetical protein
MAMTEEEKNALEVEFNQFEDLVPEFAQFELATSMDAMLAYIMHELKQPVTCASLIAAFHIMRRSGKLTKAEDPAVMEARRLAAEEEARRAERQARLEAEQNANRPLTHQSHATAANNDAEAQKESEANARKVFENLKKLRDKIMSATPPIVYFEGGPNSGKVNWGATEQARVAAGFNKDGSPRD